MTTPPPFGASRRGASELVPLGEYEQRLVASEARHDPAAAFWFLFWAAVLTLDVAANLAGFPVLSGWMVVLIGGDHTRVGIAVAWAVQIGVAASAVMLARRTAWPVWLPRVAWLRRPGRTGSWLGELLGDKPSTAGAACGGLAFFLLALLAVGPGAPAEFSRRRDELATFTWSQWGVAAFAIALAVALVAGGGRVRVWRLVTPAAGPKTWCCFLPASRFAPPILLSFAHESLRKAHLWLFRDLPDGALELIDYDAEVSANDTRLSGVVASDLAAAVGQGSAAPPDTVGDVFRFRAKFDLAPVSARELIDRGGEGGTPIAEVVGKVFFTKLFNADKPQLVFALALREAIDRFVAARPAVDAGELWDELRQLARDARVPTLRLPASPLAVREERAVLVTGFDPFTPLREALDTVGGSRASYLAVWKEYRDARAGAPPVIRKLFEAALERQFIDPGWDEAARKAGLRLLHGLNVQLTVEVDFAPGRAADADRLMDALDARWEQEYDRVRGWYEGREAELARFLNEQFAEGQRHRFAIGEEALRRLPEIVRTARHLPELLRRIGLTEGGMPPGPKTGPELPSDEPEFG